MHYVDNAIIMAAGFSSRFCPLSFEKPKGLIKVRGEILIERQIKQLKSAGINEIIIVTGYKAKKFEYLKEKFDVILIENKEYLTRNNHSSINAAKKYLKNSYICSSDNYFPENLFEKQADCAYYSALFAPQETLEWGIELDKNDKIIASSPGGFNQWYILGHAFWDEEFSKNFIKILDENYNKKEIYLKLWDEVYLDNIDKLTLKIKKYPPDSIFEFDTLDELREFDKSYLNNSDSIILKNISKILKTEEKNFCKFLPLKNGFCFNFENKKYKFDYKNQTLEEFND